MDAKHEFTSWREQLDALIKNPQDKKRLAIGVGVRPITLKRWAEGESQPREENLLRLARELSPEAATLFLNLAKEEFPALAQIHIEQNTIASQIDPGLYAQVLQMYAKTPFSLARQQLQEIILKHALEHLDPSGAGMTIGLLCCVPPQPGEKIRALYQNGGLGTHPWPRDMERKVLFVGAESLAGAAVASYRTIVADCRDDPNFLQYNWDKDEQSSVASPILRQARIAGALVVSSARPYHFTKAHKNLLELYAHLIALVFNPAEFYDSNELQLGIIPNIKAQEKYLQNLDWRVTQKLSEYQSLNKGAITIQQARQYVWQDITAELLKLSFPD